MTLLGLRAVRQWALVLLMGGIDEHRGPLLPTALIRARSCELMAAAKGAAEPDAYFSVGLLSISDALAGKPMADVMAELPLAAAVTSALIDRTGPMGAALSAAIACERGELPEHDADLALACYADAVAWTEAQGIV
jgi:EAL and modified HD-GYP domain-containing signal transduction protein